MEAVNGVSDADKGIPTAPSPLTGCYLLIVVGEPHSQEHKDIILRRIAKGERLILILYIKKYFANAIKIAFGGTG